MNTLATILVSGSLALGVVGFAAAQDQSQPSADPSAAPNAAMKSPDNMSSATLAKGHNSFTKSQAMDRIQKAGYTNVVGLMKDSNGLWQAQAMNNGQAVHVALDYKGNVSSQ